MQPATAEPATTPPVPADAAETASDAAPSTAAPAKGRTRAGAELIGVAASLGLLLLGAVWLSGSSTIALGVRQTVPVEALPALLLVLEVAEVVGTFYYVTAQSWQQMIRPGLVVLIAGTVAGVGGYLKYDWLGLVAPVMSVLVTDMIAERWKPKTAKRSALSLIRAKVQPALDTPAPAPALRAVPDIPVPQPHPDGRTLVALEQLDDLSRDELRAIAKAHKLSQKGSPVELRERVRPLLHPAAPDAHQTAPKGPEVTA